MNDTVTRTPHATDRRPTEDTDTTADKVGTRPLGAVVGAAGGAAAGAVSGIAAGPVGSLAGALVGAVLGGTAGSSRQAATGPSVRSTGVGEDGGGRPAAEADLATSATEITPSRQPRPAVDDHGDPAIRYGVQAYARFRGACDWADVEDELAAGWEEARGPGCDMDWREAGPRAHAAWLRSRQVAKHTLAGDSPDQGLQYRAPVDENLA